MFATLTIVDNGSSIPLDSVIGSFLKFSIIKFLLLILDSIVKTSVENRLSIFSYELFDLTFLTHIFNFCKSAGIILFTAFSYRVIHSWMYSLEYDSLKPFLEFNSSYI